MERVILGGVDLSESFAVVNVKRPMPYCTPELEHVPGSDGYALKSADFLPGLVQFDLIAREADEDERREMAGYIASVLYSKEPVKVEFASDNGRYYMAVPSGEVGFEEHIRCGKATVAFQPLHSAMYGDEHTAIVPSGGSVTFEVGGTYKAAPVITASAVRDGKSLVWGLRLDEGDYIHIATGSSQKRLIAVDCGKRTMTLSGNATIPTLDSDWLELEPGEHTLRMDNGTGAATVTWRERWL